MGRRPDGTHVDFDGLSEGTGDQLFLSLRLAAVEMQLQHAQPLPFIADDLFIKYSDDRAARGFKALSDLATKSQVIYFTAPTDALMAALNEVLDAQADTAGWQDFIDIAREPAPLRTALTGSGRRSVLAAMRAPRI